MSKLSTLILILLLSSVARAQPGLDLRATFPAIKAYASGPSAPVTKRFQVRPGLVRVRVTECPWYRCSDSVQYNAPVAG